MGLAGIVQRLFATHQVSVVADASSALVDVASGARFDAIVCDVADGPALHDAMVKVDADQARKMLILEAIAAPSVVEGRPYRFLAKPFRLDPLREAIAALLTPAPGSRVDT
jgi:hypothetical protein